VPKITVLGILQEKRSAAPAFLTPDRLKSGQMRQKSRSWGFWKESDPQSQLFWHLTVLNRVRCAQNYGLGDFAREAIRSAGFFDTWPWTSDIDCKKQNTKNRTQKTEREKRNAKDTILSE